MGKNIDGHIYLYPVFMGKGYCFRHILPAEIIRLGAQRKGLAAYIDGVRPVYHRGLERFKITGRYK